MAKISYPGRMDDPNHPIYQEGVTFSSHNHVRNSKRAKPETVESTDQDEAATQAAVAAVLEALSWLTLDIDDDSEVDS